MFALTSPVLFSASLASYLGDAWGIFMAVVALGVVIFVHELGHFLAARACGVKCEKFYVGFDFFGVSLWKKKWGDTVYGIGSFPLGGYVKMLGQDDNPGAIAKEAERSKAAGDEANQEPSGEGDAKAAEQEAPPKLDPKSYLAKSVPQRMLIISAGVIFNLISGAVFAAIAYSMGVDYSPCVIGSLMPGAAAWEGGLEPGDEVLQIGDQPPRELPLQFRDLQSKVVFGGSQSGLKFRVRRGDEELEVTLHPQRDEQSGRPLIGVLSPMKPTLSEVLPVDPSCSAAGQTDLRGGETITAMDGSPIADAADVLAAMEVDPAAPLVLTVEAPAPRKGADKASTDMAPREVTVPANRRKRFGLSMTMGPISAVRVDSPAADAGLKPGDVVLSVNGAAVADPMLLEDQLRAWWDQDVTLGVQRGDEVLEIVVTPRQPRWFDRIGLARSTPMTSLSIGVAYDVEPIVAAVTPGSPAEVAGFQVGDQVLKAISEYHAIDDPDFPEEAAYLLQRFEFDFTNTAEVETWPAFLLGRVQATMPGREFVFEVDRGGETQSLTATWRLADGEYEAERGLNFEALIKEQQAASFADAVRLGVRETYDHVVMTGQFVKKLFEKDGVSPKNLGGPGTIFVAASSSAQQGMPALLMFLTLISANLAVLNILPVPVLDGGHLVFLAYEGIFRKPPSEKVIIALSYVGLAMVLCLMLYATSRDVTRFLEWIFPR